MAKIDIFSGFLGAGKTTLIKKLIKEAYKNEKLVLIENEFGEIGIDGGFMQDAGIEVTEMNSGCICCSLVGDFGEALKKVIAEYAPDRILIEPSGVGKLSDVIRAVNGVTGAGARLNSYCTVVDANKCKMYMKNFGEFFNDQVKSASCIILSHTKTAGEEKLAETIKLIREINEHAQIVSTDWDQLEASAILAVMENIDTLENDLKALEEDEDVCPECGHHHHGEHHHHCEHEHEHHHHHADEVFTSWGKETVRTFTKAELENALSALSDQETYGTILRAKGIVRGENEWIHFDYVPGEPDIRTGSAAAIGRLCVIGSKINENELENLFHI